MTYALATLVKCNDTGLTLKIEKPMIQPSMIDQIIENILSGLPINRWNVLGKVPAICARLLAMGKYTQEIEDMLWDLHDEAKISQ